MIVLGIIVLLATDYFDKDVVEATDTNNQNEVAK
jgi:hypothetical protein